MARRIAIAVLVLGGVLVVAFTGFDGLLVFVVLVAVAWAFTAALGSAGEWLQRSSRRRFDDDARRR